MGIIDINLAPESKRAPAFILADVETRMNCKFTCNRMDCKNLIVRCSVSQNSSFVSYIPNS